jgi:tyrosyl-tRNA synthetase
VEEFAATYIEQARGILLEEPLEIRRNSEWLGTMGIEDVLRLTARTTVARMLERDDFSRRYRDGVAISVMEFLYPLLQGWDSVMVQADVELGGTDQLFNNLMGRTLQEQEGQEGQCVLTTPLLEGLDGVNKMSKSLGNFVGIAEPPGEQFGKLLSLPDELMPRYFTLVTGWHPDRIDEVTGALAAGELLPVDAKRLLARTVVDLYHGAGAGAAAQDEFDKVFRSHDVPTDMEELIIPAAAAELRDGRIRLANLLHLAFPRAVPSNKEGRRKIEQGGVKLGGAVVTEPDLEVTPAEVDGETLQMGKRNWARLRAGG